MAENKLLAYLNGASREDLRALPGIGESLADTLLEMRPFESLDEVRVIRGINENRLQQFADALSEDVTEEESVDETSSNIVDDDKEGLAELKDKPAQTNEATRQAVSSIPERSEHRREQRGAFWSNIVNGIVVVVVSIFLTLAILGGINGSLKFLTSSNARALEANAEKLADQADALQQELDGIRSRVDTLEGLGKRTVALESAQEALNEDLAATNEKLASLESDLEDFAESIRAQNESIERFDTFFARLQAILNDIFVPETNTDIDTQDEEGAAEATAEAPTDESEGEKNE